MQAWGALFQHVQTSSMLQSLSPQRRGALTVYEGSNLLLPQQAGKQPQQLLQGATSQGFPPTLLSPSAQQLGTSQQASPQGGLSSPRLAGAAERTSSAAGPTAPPALQAPGVSSSQASAEHDVFLVLCDFSY